MKMLTICRVAFVLHFQLHLTLSVSFRSICIKELLTPIIPVLKDLEKGLQYFCLLCQVKKHPGLFKLFTCSSQYEVTVENFLDKLTVVYGEQQFPKNLEDDIFRYFIDSILGLYHEGM